LFEKAGSRDEMPLDSLYRKTVLSVSLAESPQLLTNAAESKIKKTNIELKTDLFIRLQK
jgi:hypothetical protein